MHKDAGYWTPNGNHRLQALKKLGYRAVTALVVPDADIAFKILALNTEKAHNLREKSLETIRMARALAKDSDAPEASYAFEFEQPSFLTLGVCYEERPRMSGGAYQSIAARVRRQPGPAGGNRWHVVMRLLAKEPDARYQTAAAIATDIRLVAAELDRRMN